MVGGGDIGGSCLAQREAQGVGDLAGGDLIKADEAGENGQSRRIGTRPARGALRVGLQVEDRSRARFPTPVGLRIGSEELVELVAVTINEKDMPIPLALLPSLNRHLGRDWIGTRVAFSRVFKSNRNGLLRGTDDRKGNPKGPKAMTCPEIKVDVGIEPNGL